ncbi:MAG: S24 family peptidase [Bacillota bacterium]
MNPIDRLIELVKHDPAITVAELAASLGYSEEKSVYYWLEKAGYSGIREFKRDVLGKDRQQSNVADYSEDTVLSRDKLKGNPFTFKVTSSQYAPYFMENDILIVDPLAVPANGDLVLVSHASGSSIMRYYRIDKHVLLTSIADPTKVVQPGSEVTILGRVTKLVRTF